MLKELTLVLLVVLSQCKIEYYSKLGLSRGASTQEIKRAFKRLATKYHPDRAPANQKEEYNRMFSEISDAYSVLSDPELKQHYDHGGHDALERHRQHQEYHNQHKARQEFHESMVTNHFENTDLTILNMNTLSRFYRRSQVWLVLFYRSQDPEMKSGLKENILELNNKFYGIFTVAAVNCDQDDGICDEYRAMNTPDILGFKSEVTHDGERYTGDKLAPKMAGFAVSLMQSFVSVVTPENIDDFLKDDSKIKMLLFSDKKEAPPIMKALSKEFRTSIDIALVKDASGQVMRRFGVQQVPTIIILKKVDGETWSPISYQGQVTVMALSEFIREHRDLTSGSKKKQKKINDVRDPVNFASMGCGSDSKQVCIFLLYDDDSERQKSTEILEAAVSSLAEEPINVFTVPKQMINFAKLSIPETSRILIIKPNKNRLHAADSLSDDLDSFNSLVDKIIGGTLMFKASPHPIFESFQDQAQTDL